MRSYYSLSAYFKNRFGGAVRKIALDAGSSCPNRNGRLSYQGCLFCNAKGSGTGLWEQGLNLEQQWEFMRSSGLGKPGLAMAYLQSFSNTYGSLERLQDLLGQVIRLPGLAGLCLGSRPDCLEREKLLLLARQNIQEIWLDVGLQSCRDKTLRLINRGHDSACFAASCSQAAELGLKVCAHVIAGLPGEEPADFLATVAMVNSLPAAGIKFHNLYVPSGTALAEMWRQGRCRPPDLEDYLLRWLLPALKILRPDIVVHRLLAEPAPGESLAPLWSMDKAAFIRRVDQGLCS